MLLRFAVANFKSIFNRIELNFQKSSNSSELSHHLINYRDEKYLKAAAILGANASGKSNIIEALGFAIGLIKKPNHDGISVPYFRLNPEARNIETEFEFDVAIEGISYWYSFAFKENQVSYEILKVIEGKREILVFSRENGEYKFGDDYWSSDDVAAISPIKSVVKKDNLFLGELKTRETKLTSLLRWFTTKVVFLNEAELEKNLKIIKHNLSETDLLKISNHISVADVGISEIKVVDETKLLEAIFHHVSSDTKTSEEQKELLKKYFLEKHSRKIEIVHKAKDSVARFDFSEESAGTQKYIKILPILLNLNEGLTFICDELETSLHPKLIKYFIQTFFNENSSTNSQIIFTTHEHTLLDLSVLRRDEIWFVQKSNEHITDIYSLAEFRGRNDMNLAKAYFEGRFGGIPILNSYFEHSSLNSSTSFEAE